MGIPDDIVPTYYCNSVCVQLYSILNTLNDNYAKLIKEAFVEHYNFKKLDYLYKKTTNDQSFYDLRESSRYTFATLMNSADAVKTNMKDVMTKLAKYDIQDKKDLRGDEKQRIQNAKDAARTNTVSVVKKDIEDTNMKLDTQAPKITNDRMEARQFINKIPSDPRNIIDLNLYADLSIVLALQDLRDYSVKYLEKRVKKADNPHKSYLTNGDYLSIKATCNTYY